VVQQTAGSAGLLWYPCIIAVTPPECWVQKNVVNKHLTLEPTMMPTNILQSQWQCDYWKTYSFCCPHRAQFFPLFLENKTKNSKTWHIKGTKITFFFRSTV